MLRTPTLDDIITFSCGIGRSYNEAEHAVNTAKSKKGEFTGPSRLDPNIAVYNEAPMQDGEDAPSNAVDYERILRRIMELPQNAQELAAMERIGRDPRTGLYNTMGYRHRRLELGESGINDGYLILLDGNNMKQANEKIGSLYVDTLLAEAGKGLIAATRSGTDRRDSATPISNDRRDALNARRKTEYKEDIVAHRVHNDGGDEFLIFVPNPHEIDRVRGIAERALGFMYIWQGRYIRKNLMF